jgi:hypothetical protein
MNDQIKDLDISTDLPVPHIDLTDISRGGALGVLVHMKRAAM